MQSDQRSPLWLWLGPVLGALAIIFALGLVLYVGRFFGLLFGNLSVALGFLVLGFLLAVCVTLRNSAWRSGAIFGGYVAACLVAGFALAIVLFVNEYFFPRPWTRRPPDIADLVPVGFGTSAFAFVLMLLPVSLAIWYAERKARRSPLYYGIIGAIATAPLAILLSKGHPSSWWIVASGVLGSLTYWAIAGRKAGEGR